jgi:uncharacterized protein YifN (PemK superfamily)
MPLPFQPKPRTVLYCDFAGYIAPEIVKRRPVIVLNAHKRNSKLVTVVPLSTTQPEPIESYHHQLHQNPVPGEAATRVWAKCDLVAVVSTERLEMIRAGRAPNGKREYVIPKIGMEQFDTIRRGVATALGLGNLLVPLPQQLAKTPTVKISEKSH